MLRRCVVGSLCGFAILLGGTLAWSKAAPKPTAAKIKWEKDIFKAHDVAVATGKPMLVIVTATWCGPCQKLKKSTLSHPQIAEFVNASFVPVQVDFDRDEKIAAILEVEQVPASMVLSPESDLLGRLDGYVSVKKYRAMLKQSRRLQSEIRQAKHSDD